MLGGVWKATGSRRVALGWTAAIVVWAAAVAGGTVALARYKSTPGAGASPPEHWPIASIAAHQEGKASLVMLAHPLCPCTRASLAELGVVMTHAGDRVTATVLFLHPEGVDGEWDHGELWRLASSIPGVHVMADPDGSEARLFAVSTSGDTLLYGSGDALLFHGGITSARGHVGDSIGLSRLVLLLDGKTPDRNDSPVFGCSLWDPNATSAAEPR